MIFEFFEPLFTQSNSMELLQKQNVLLWQISISVTNKILSLWILDTRHLNYIQDTWVLNTRHLTQKLDGKRVFWFCDTDQTLVGIASRETRSPAGSASQNQKALTFKSKKGSTLTRLCKMKSFVVVFVRLFFLIF